MSKEKGNKKEIEREEFSADLSPDDLDVREENDLTKEQIENSKQVNQNKYSAQNKK
ncbi:hypothetical protein [Solibacillus sp. CAU 1738]|uniref:hypothetical protein n=1 Tax=Solibacillus sp. CAU 1738 TaxID=3140363 RepID=UPI003261B791